MHIHKYTHARTHKTNTMILPKYTHAHIYVTCSNEMSRMSANLISRKHRINMQRRFSTILTFCHQSILWYLFCQLAMLVSRLYYYLVHFIAFLDTLIFTPLERLIHILSNGVSNSIFYFFDKRLISLEHVTLFFYWCHIIWYYLHIFYYE